MTRFFLGAFLAVGLSLYPHGMTANDRAADIRHFWGRV